MTHDHISFLTTDVSITRTYSPTKYELRVEMGWLWLQKVCFRVLDKIGARSVNLEYKVNRVDISFKTVMEALARQHGELLSRYALRGERLLIGAEDFATLVRDDTYIGRSLSFSIPNALYKTEGHAITIMGLNITIIPWMKGMLVLPKDWDKN